MVLRFLKRLNEILCFLLGGHVKYFSLNKWSGAYKVYCVNCNKIFDKHEI